MTDESVIKNCLKDFEWVKVLPPSQPIRVMLSVGQFTQPPFSWTGLVL